MRETSETPLGVPFDKSTIWAKASDVAAVAVMFHFTCVSWLLFRAESIPQAIRMFVSIFANFSFDLAAYESLSALAGFTSILLAAQLIQYFKNDLMFVFRMPVPLRGAFCGVLLYFMLIHGAVSDAFIYFQF